MVIIPWSIVNPKRRRCVGEARERGDVESDHIFHLFNVGIKQRCDRASTSIVEMFYPVYVRGQACLLLHRGSAAAAEFQKFLDHRGVVAMNFGPASRRSGVEVVTGDRLG